MALLLSGCLAPPAAAPKRPMANHWLDRVVAPGEQIVFLGPQARLSLTRTGAVVRFEVRPSALSVPRFELSANAPAGPPRAFQPRWAELVYTTIGRPYRVRDVYPSATQPGSVTWFMPTRTKTDPFNTGLSAYWSPLHLVLLALGPLPEGETRVRVVHKDGRDYYATIQADATGRRVLRFPNALLWSDWSDKNLADTCVFEVVNVHAWPATSIRTENFTRRGPIAASFSQTRPAGSGL